MGKYIIRYLVFWLPAMLVSCFYNHGGMVSQLLQWVFAFLMLLGWSVNTGMAAYNYPRNIMALLFTYAGFNILIISVMYASSYRSAPYVVLRAVGGVLSFTPLDIFAQALKPYNSLPGEFVVLITLLVCCIIGLLAGLLQRRVRPNPYRPRIMRRGR